MTAPRIPRPRPGILRGLRRACRRIAWAAPAVFERAAPLLLAALTGLILGLSVEDRRAADQVYVAEVRAVAAKRRQIAAQALASQYAIACGSRLSLPIESVPEIIPTATGGQP